MKYLAYFPHDEESYRMKFHYAQALFETKHFKEAAVEFEALSKDGNFSEFREETAYHRILSVELNEEKGEQGVAEVIIAKNKVGESGVVKLSFQKLYTKFGNLTYRDNYKQRN